MAMDTAFGQMNASATQGALVVRATFVRIIISLLVPDTWVAHKLLLWALLFCRTLVQITMLQLITFDC